LSPPRKAHRAILAFALGLPEAWEDHPWDECVVKVGAKVFVFMRDPDAGEQAITVKLRDSHELGLSLPGAAPTGYGLGKAGWVTVPFTARTPVGVLTDLVEESYRTIAPRRLVTELDARG
jgi:predicted DNA-binding protein (MmcQ/YjbR family)